MSVASPFDDFDLAGFWDGCDYARKEYVEPWPSDETIASIESELGYKLPEAYIALCRSQNGGFPVRTRFRTDKRTSWAPDHVAIQGIGAIGRKKSWSLCGQLGSKFHIGEWEYPPIGVYFGSCPSAGHDLIALDYRHCGPSGEPSVVHVDQEWDYEITFVAPTFEAFIRGLEPDEAFPIDDDPDIEAKVVWADLSGLPDPETVGIPTGLPKKPWWKLW